MLAHQPQTNANVFLEALSAPDLELLRTHLAAFELRPGDCLHHFGDTVENVVFPRSGLVVRTLPLGEDAGAFMSFVGRDGVVGGFAAVGGAPANCDAHVLVSGHASRMPASSFRHLLDQSPGIRRLAARLDSAMLVDAQQTALCNAVHPVEDRICRLLLEFQDRIDLTRVTLTQAALAQMLGVRRTTVTLLVGRLEAAGIIVCGRGAIEIISRRELERHSCECYGQVKNYARRLFPRAAEGIVATATGSGERLGRITG